MRHPLEISSIVANAQALAQDINKLTSDTLNGCSATHARLLEIEDILADILLKATDASLYAPRPPMGASASSVSAAATSMAVTSFPLGNSTSLGPYPTSPLTTSYPIVAGKTFTASYTTETTITTTISGTAEILTSTIATYSLAPTAPAYTFNPNAKDNLAVYYGQSPDTQAEGLISLCEQADVDIVILAFVDSFFGPQAYPVVNFGAACYPPNTAQEEQAPGLLDCSKLASQIAGCQQIGKKASHFAETLWQIFGSGREPLDLRPFGKDVCPIPDQSIPLGAMQQADFVFVQHYNNPSCNLNSTGFASSFLAWSKQLLNSTTPGKPRLYVGAAAFPAAGSGYVNGSELQSYIEQVKNVTNFGGMMLWDGSEGAANVDEYGVSYLDYAKAAAVQ
ncbi:hypothetical protein LTR08_006224 [Meristemomyces frigidus]|nr:hypothetical protein LTR08_006224 [Meristemomyces frigidus]